MNPLVSVIINCYNGEEYLRETLESLVAQSYTNWELIFWDNRSTDGTADVVREFSDERIRYHLAPEHTGLGAARNLALEKAAGDWLAFLDADDLWHPEKLAEQVRWCLVATENGAEPALCYTQYMDFQNEAPDTSAFDAPGSVEIGELLNQNLANYEIGMLALMVNRRLMRERGIRFDPRLAMMEDYDVAVRLLAAGPAVAIRKMLSYRRDHAASLSYKSVAIWFAELRILGASLFEPLLENAGGGEFNRAALQAAMRQGRKALYIYLYRLGRKARFPKAIGNRWRVLRFLLSGEEKILTTRNRIAVLKNLLF